MKRPRQVPAKRPARPAPVVRLDAVRGGSRAVPAMTWDILKQAPFQG
jgi:hypothetical protein